jgi:hypothetical protein
MVVVEDLGSTNGTFVNGAPLTSSVALTAGTSVRLGGTVIELAAESDAIDAEAVSVRPSAAGMPRETSIELVAKAVERQRPDAPSIGQHEGTVTIAFSDIESSTEQATRIGDRAWIAVLNAHNAIIRRNVERWGGNIVKNQGDGFMLTGAAGFVQDADLADWILVTASAERGLSQFLIGAGTPGVTIRPLEGLDLTRRFSEVRFDDVELPASALVGQRGTAASTVGRQLDVALALTVAEMVGAMDRDFEVVLDYAKVRTAFGRPIGSFQAVKHLLADTSLALEMSKAMAVAAARSVGSAEDDATEVASMAKAFVSDSAVDLAQNCWQVFGGIGYTWEHDQHLYLRRLTTDAALYGDAAWHRERVWEFYGL